MYNLIVRFIKFLMPILGKASLQVAADTLTEAAYPTRRPRRMFPYTPYNRMREYVERDAELTTHLHDKIAGATFDQHAAEAMAMVHEPRADVHRFPAQRFTSAHPDQTAAEYHDVLMVAFDVRGPNRETVHTWLLSNMPESGYHPIGYIKGHNITLDDYWIANDDSDDDRDSAVFVAKGNQELARDALRRERLSSE